MHFKGSMVTRIDRYRTFDIIRFQLDHELDDFSESVPARGYRYNITLEPIPEEEAE